MRDITLMPNDYIVTHIKTDTICEHFINDDVVYAVDERIVPLVRCKECKYEPICTHSVQHTTHELTSVTIGYKSVDFCSYGEREGE